jgi:small subunit ribosomal protein S6
VRDYELGIVVNPEASEEQTRAIIDRVAQLVATSGGQTVRVDAWGRRRLAYPIEHHRDGYYVFIDLNMNPEGVAEIDRNLRVSEEVIRHIIVKRDPKVVAAARAAATTAAAEPAPQTAPSRAAEGGTEEPSPEPEIEVEAAPVAESGQ